MVINLRGQSLHLEISRDEIQLNGGFGWTGAESIETESGGSCRYQAP